MGQIVINYSDFRTVEGLSLPFKMTATFDGQPFPALVRSDRSHNDQQSDRSVQRSRVLKRTRVGDKTNVEEVWANRPMRVHFTNAIRVGHLIYGSSGDFGPALFTAVDDKTGNILWRNRSFPWASFLLADGRFIILDEDGHLLLATATREGLTVTSKAELLSNQSWTVSSLSGTRLYLRDRKNIIAVDLGRQ